MPLLLERMTACSLTTLVASIDVPGLQRKLGSQITHKRQTTKQPHQNGEPVWAIELDGNQLGELGRDICHRTLCCVQATSRAEQRADFTESFIRRAVHDGNEQVTR